MPMALALLFRLLRMIDDFLRGCSSWALTHIIRIHSVDKVFFSIIERRREV
jgi:hypothetical protein